MVASSRWAHESWPAANWRGYRDTFALPTALLLVLMLVGSALLLLIRRSAGALAEPLSAGPLILVGSCVAMAVIGSRYLSGRVRLPEARAITHVVQWGPTLGVAMFAVALSIDGTSMPAMTLYLAIIVGAEVFAERGPWISGKARAFAGGFKPIRNANIATPLEPLSDRDKSLNSVATDEQSCTITVEESVEVEASDWELARANESLEELPEAVLEGAWQQVTRARTPEGELITGWVKTEFQPGERTAVLHVAFCPPLEKVPEIEIEQLSGPAARIKAAQVLPQGARFEIRLNVPAVETESLMVAFVAARPIADS